MRKKIIIAIIFLIGFVLMLNLHKVQAYSGELDPENYITFPNEISIKNNIGTGTVTLSSMASGYNISYQKIDITKEKYDKITAKNNEHNSYVGTAQKTINEKEANLTALQKKYQDLQKDETATEEQIATAKANYDEEYAKYEEYFENAKTQEEKLKKEYLALIPDYTSSWKTAKNTSNNIVLDFSNYNGTAYFVLWVKISNGTNTYYDFDYYSPKIKTTENGNSNGGNSGTGTETNSGLGKWANAVVEVKYNQESYTQYNLLINGVNYEENHSYKYFIGDGSYTPEFSETYKDCRTDLKIEDISKYLELSQEYYLYVWDSYKENGKEKHELVLNKAKIEKPKQKKYSDAFRYTFWGEGDAHIILNTPKGRDTVRKLHIKIGKIKDESILKNIYNKKISAFENLLNYARKSESFYDKTVESNLGEYTCGLKTSESLFSVSNLETGEYYFLYVVAEDENGKYIKTEAVTLAQANVYNGGWSLFFYGSEDFSWKDFSSDTDDGKEPDDTIAPDKLPNTGAVSIVIATLTITTGGIIAYKKYKKYNF